MELRNYRKFRSASVEFPDGVVGIVGQNGSGKSTLVEAVAWCLYGNEKDIVRSGKEGIRSAGAGPNDECSVTLVFSIEGDEYRLHRAMKGSGLAMDATLTVNGVRKAKGDRDVTKAVEGLLGMDYKAFFISVFARQKELNALTSLGPAERKRYVLRMLGLDALDEVVRLVDQDGGDMRRVRDALQAELIGPDGRPKRDALEQGLAAGEAEADKARAELAELESRARELDAEALTLREERDRLAAKDQEHQGLRQRQAELAARLRSADESLGSMRRQLDAVRKKAAEMASLEPCSTELEAAQKERDRLEGLSSQSREARRLLAGIEVAGGKLAKLDEEARSTEKGAMGCDEAKTGLEEVERNLDKARGEREELHRMMGVLDSELARHRKDLKELDRRMEEIGRLGPEGKCPTCERALEDQHTVLMQKMRAEAAQAKADVAELERQRVEAEGAMARCAQRLEVLGKRRKERDEMCTRAARAAEALERLRAQRSALAAEMEADRRAAAAIGPVEFDEAGYEALKRRLVELRPKAERYRELRAQAARAPEIEAEIDDLVGRRAALAEEAAGVERDISSLGYLEGSYRKAQGRLDALLAEKERAARELSVMGSALASKESEMRARRDRLAELLETEGKVEERSKAMEQQAVLGKAMKDFRASIVGRVVPTLAEISSHMFSELTDAKYPGLELSEGYEISVLDRGERYPLSRFSGGESDLANLCLRLAISRVIAERSGSAVNFLILDEIFGSQDQARKRNILEAFSQLSKQFRQIILITHIEDVKDLVANAILVQEREDGSSVVETVS